MAKDLTQLEMMSALEPVVAQKHRPAPVDGEGLASPRLCGRGTRAANFAALGGVDWGPLTVPAVAGCQGSDDHQSAH